jgi:hypothetical protein
VVNYRTALWGLHEAVIYAAYPPLVRYDLSDMLFPFGIGPFTLAEFLPETGKARTIVRILHRSIILLVLLGFLSFQLYAFNKLRVVFGFRDLLVYVSFVIALLFTYMSFLLIVVKLQP